MATYTTNAPFDQSTFANFKLWAQAITETAFSNFGWTQTNDTGQVVWTATVLTLTQVASSGGNSVYSYSSFTGPAPRVGMSVTITGFATGGNNVTATLTAVSGGASGTVTVATTTQGNETHAGSGTTTAQSTVPTNGNYVYAIWTQADGLIGTSQIYIKMEAGTNTGPGIRVTVGTSTNGSGTITGVVLSGFNLTFLNNNGSGTTNNGGTLFPCYFSGDSAEFRALMWINQSSTSQAPCYFAVERAKDNTGANIGDYITVLKIDGANGNTGRQQTIMSNGLAATYETNLISVICGSTNSATGSFNGTVAAFPLFPLIGKLGNPMLGTMCCVASDVAEASTVTVASWYSGTHTCIATKAGTVNNGIRNIGTGIVAGNTGALLMRYE